MLIFDSLPIHVLLTINDLLNTHKFAIFSDPIARHYLLVKLMFVFFRLRAFFAKFQEGVRFDFGGKSDTAVM
jgi:hypothetical protein